MRVRWRLTLPLRSRSYLKVKLKKKNINYIFKTIVWTFHLNFNLNLRKQFKQTSRSNSKLEMKRPSFCSRTNEILLGLFTFSDEKTYWYCNVSYYCLLLLLFIVYSTSRISGVTGRIKTIFGQNIRLINTRWNRYHLDPKRFRLLSYLPLGAKSSKACYLYFFLTVRSSNLKPFSTSNGRFYKL